MELNERDVASVYYATLLQHVGCTAYAYETAALLGGDDIAVRAGGARIDDASPKEALPFLLFELGRNATPIRRARAVIMAVSKGQQFDKELYRSNCEVAVQMARRLSLGTMVERGLNEIYERWDGKGNPHGLSSEDIALPARFAQVSSQAVLFDRLGGPAYAAEMIGRRAGTVLDPSVAEVFLRRGRGLLTEIASTDASFAVIEAEPEPRRWISESRLDEMARAFADLVDLKSPFTHGHSVEVSNLAKAAATNLGLQGRLDAEAVRAVLEAAGHPPARLTWPAGLSDREVQVLRLLTRGYSNREMARLLWISPKTTGHHVQHIYAKIGVSTRAAAAMFAMEHDLIRQ